MRKLLLFLTIILSLFTLNSCDGPFSIFSEDGEEVTIVYGYLDADADTNYLKITKSFTGNAVDLAPNYSANNYDYKLDVKLTGKFATNPNAVRTVIFDTTSVFKPYNPDGLFYSGVNQVLYYTSEKLLENQEYQLVITRNDGEVITSKVKTICGSKIRQPIYTMSFDSPYTKKIEWRSNTFNKLAAYYEVVGYFHYKQIDPGQTDTTYHKMKWFFGSGTGEEMYNSSTMNMFVNYTPTTFFSKLASDANIANNTSTYTQRFVDCFEIVVTATGDELYNYILIQNSNSAIMDTPEYTNINNGLGIFSSRSVCTHKVEIDERTVNTLIRDYPQWGFVKVY
jgi:hypothetical protein